MNRIRIAIGALLTTWSLTAHAHEASQGRVHAGIGPYLFKTNYTNTPQYGESPLLGGFALFASGDIDYHGGPEITLIYMNNLYRREVADQYALQKVKRIHITTGYRHWFNPDFSMSAGFYSSYSIGDRDNIYPTPPSPTIDTSARDVVEYGFDFSIQWEPVRIDRLALVLDARYSLSITDKYREDSDLYGALVAVKYFVQEGSKRR